jgi:choline dehydrogenase-like flavoprotein
MFLGGMGESLPYYDNQIALDDTKTDKWGIPQVKVSFGWGDNERKMAKDMANQAEAMLVAAGGKIIMKTADLAPGGLAIHEMGTARMGHDPKTSVLNSHNQAHDVANLFVTDGACMTGCAAQNPSLTYMALTARACDYAVTQMKAGAI